MCNEPQARNLGDLTYEERESIVAEYLRGGISQSALWRKYSGNSTYHGEVLVLLRSFGYEPKKKAVMRPQSSNGGTAMAGSTQSNGALEQRTRERYISELEHRLKEAELKVALYESMIEIAEDRFKIPIKKKFGSKPPSESQD